MDARPGAVLAVDVGSVRTGVAVSDPDRTIATPLETVTTPDHSTAVTAVTDLARRHGVAAVVVGWPVGLSGRPGAAAETARAFASALAARVEVPVRLVDERFTTSTAQGMLREAGRTGRRGRTTRQVVDQVAAVVLLQHVLDAGQRGVELGTVVPAGAGTA